MLDFSETQIKSMILHRVGNPVNEEPLDLSEHRMTVPDDELSNHLFTYFLSAFKQPEFFTFTKIDNEFAGNPTARMIAAFFNEETPFQPFSCQIAQRLYDTSTHPQIKAGDLFVVHFSNILIDDQETDAIGLFKSEIKYPFIKVDETFEDIKLQAHKGILTDKLDKGCIVFNINNENGFKICSVDKSSKNGDVAHFWSNEFLKLEPFKDEFFLTANYMNMARDFVANELPEVFQVSKPDQMDLLNKSVAYFKDKEVFVKEDFEEEVFHHEDVINSFRNFDEKYQKNHNVEFEASFEISPNAVKKQAKVFKSILKLDKNFHVYIHGNREKIEKGVEEDGRKFYKLYFDVEN